MAERRSCLLAKAGAGPRRQLLLVRVHESTNMLLLMVAAAAPLERGRRCKGALAPAQRCGRPRESLTRLQGRYVCALVGFGKADTCICVCCSVNKSVAHERIYGKSRKAWRSLTHW
jgi:hypothetical protein